MHARTTTTLATVLVVAATTSLAAQTSFGSQPSLTFGGTGISNAAVVSNSDAGTLGVLLGLTATPRCFGAPQSCGPAITNDGVNTFFAQPGLGEGPNDATWNFDFAAVGDNVANYNYVLSFAGPGASGSFDVPTCFFIGFEYCPIGSQDSENLGFFSPTFDPTASGQYRFDLDAFDPAGGTDPVASTEMFVDVGDVSVTPEPATMSLMAFGLVGLAGVRRRYRRS